jgi:2-polyprenyl-6-hydroxyphenyl methylase/3-demethylubiquinone-9 3-methyltransferase
VEQHGPAEALLRYRLDLIRAAARFSGIDTVLEIGCGNGLHLLALAAEFARGIGTDLSPRMIEAARERNRRLGYEDRVEFLVDKGEELSSMEDRSVDVAFCTGSLEHMIDQGRVFSSAYRVLRPGGRFVCLTLNGGSVWYRLAPRLGFDTRRLSTDRYLRRSELEDLARQADFANWKVDTWTFVQRGDVPKGIARMLDLADRVGRFGRLGFFRGGLRLAAVK